MTATKVLERLMLYAPPILAATTRTRARCIAATALGCDVLHAFDIQAEPYPVIVSLANAAYVAAEKRGADPVTAIARGGHLMIVGDEGREPNAWPGHLVIRLPQWRALIDLDFQQFGRPKQNIHVDAAEVLPWPAGTTSRRFRGPDGAELVITASEDDRWQRSPDWCDEARRAPMVAALCRAIRKNRL